MIYPVDSAIQRLNNRSQMSDIPPHRELRPLLFSNSVGSFTSHRINHEELWDGAYGLSSLSEKTRKSNHLQMSLKKPHFLLSYLKTSRTLVRNSTYWANRSAVKDDKSYCARDSLTLVKPAVLKGLFC